ncbi:MAG: FAD:protein FMN transferase [Clostridia bacterium]|nr:FAD:protein FMN transferase [Clostridia bacterium]
MKRTVFLLLFICAFTAFLLSGCTGAAETYTDTAFFAMDTVITLRLPRETEFPWGTEENICSLVEDRVAVLESVFSRTKAGSEISLFNHAGAGNMTLSDETAAVLSAALSVAAATDGAYDPTVAPLSELWNITGASPAVPTDTAIRDALSRVGYEQLSLDGNTLSKTDGDVMLDLGGCAKGYACHAAVELLLDAGVSHGIVSFGGNIGVFGKKTDGTKWKVGIKDPASPDSVAGYLSVDAGYVSVSGDYERYFEENGIRYHHIFNRETGYPADSGVRSVAVFSTDAVLADALSTALFVMGAEDGMVLYDTGTFSFEAVWYLSDGTTVLTQGIIPDYEHVSANFTKP